jgi:acetyl esterase/lipase
MAGKFPLLEGVSSIPELFENPALADRRQEFEDHGGFAPPAVTTRMDEVPGPHGPVPVRIYAPDSPGGAPCLVWMHGGGFIGGDLDMPEADWVARELVSRAGIVVVSVGYRLCTGGVTYPVPHDDVVAAVRWVRENAAGLGADGGRISIGGASAGAALAAGVAVRLRDEDGWAPAHLILGYPVAHPVIPPPSVSLAALMAEVPPALRFPAAATAFITMNYLGGAVSRADGYAFAGLAALEGLGPVLILNAEYDDLRPSGEAFAAALALAGVDVRQVRVRTMLHGFLNLPASIGPISGALDLIAEAVAGRVRPGAAAR